MTDNTAFETAEYTITGPEGARETVEIPAGLGDAFAEEEESPTAVAADFLVQAFAQQTHSLVHHSAAEPPSELKELDAQMETVFEERFDISIAEVLGHDH